MTHSLAILFIAFCLSTPIAIAGSLSGVTPEQVGEHYDPPLTEKPKLDLPVGSRNLALGRSVTTNFPQPLLGCLEMITDGDKGVVTYPDGRLRFVDADNCHVEFSPSVPGVIGDDAHGLGPRYIQFDLQDSVAIDAVWIWPGYREHGYDVVRKLVVQASHDPSFTTDSTTIFNCDTSNSMGFGIGVDRPFATSRFGKLIQPASISGRFVRIWWDGSVMFPFETRIVEVEIYGRSLTSMQGIDGFDGEKAARKVSNSHVSWAIIGIAFFLASALILRGVYLRKRSTYVSQSTQR